MKEHATTYDPKIAEERWYSFWESQNLFKADSKSNKPPYCIILPPPNVTGALHMGHALVDTIQDILIRWKRMKGFETLWMPGTDHAGIATQAVVERHLYATTGKRRTEFSREEFLSHIWEWKAQYEERILCQIKKLGCSCDWSRLRFTMDEQSSTAVRVMFKKMYDEGLIYRGDYLVNWDPVLGTALSDDEVEHEERDSFLWYFRYPLEEDPDQYIVIATTRPETMLGDVAVAISPSDPRYTPWVGKRLLLPLMNRSIPIIADHAIDAAFGSGAVKITPAHDYNDSEIGARHHLPVINIMTEQGTINENGGRFQGLSMADARDAIVKEMQALKLVDKIEPHRNRIGLSYRSKAVVEPFLSKQWFIKMDSFKERLLSLVREKKVEITPDEWEKVYFHWINNLRDWCISRQLWWGHRVPIWYHKEDPSRIICHSGSDLPLEVAQNPEAWRQDEDVLDTWFSSSLWPLSTLGWPNATGDLAKFYPTSVLVTGHDILFFWVARMILMGDYATGSAPFAQTFLHGLIYGKSYWRVTHEGNIAYVTPEERNSYEIDQKPVPKDVHSKWEKMSKSKGNIIDPIEIVDSYGADALRLALASSVTPSSKQIDLDRKRFEEFKNFANKIWNAARFLFLNIDDLDTAALQKGLNPALFTLDDRFMLSRLNRTLLLVDESLTSFSFERAVKDAYTFFWDEFCAYYVESSKPYLFGKEGNAEVRANKQKLLVIIFTASIRLLHPIAPFITEELFALVKEKFEGFGEPSKAIDPYTKELQSALSKVSCMVAPYPYQINVADIDDSVEANFNLVQQIIYAIRNLRAELRIPPGQAVDVYIIGENKARLTLLLANKPLLFALTRIENLHISSTVPELSMTSTAIVEELQILVPLPAALAEQEALRLKKEIEKISTQIDALKAKLANPDFTARAPKALVQQTENALSLQQESHLSLTKKLSLLG